VKVSSVATRLLLLTLTIIGLGLVVIGQGSPNQREAQQLKKQISSALRAPWRITGFETVNSAPSPWSFLFPDATQGYAVSCENTSQNIQDSGMKSDSAAPAVRHPRFVLWLFTRSRSITPGKVEADSRKLHMSPIQVAIPDMLGFNDQFVVSCVYDCSHENVRDIVTALGLRQLPD